MKNRASAFPFLIILGCCSLVSGLSPQYHFVNDQKNWTEAQKYCREKYSDMASMYNRAGIESIREAVHGGFSGRAWIGLERGNLFKWQWSLADRDFYRDRELEFRNWKQGKPKNDHKESCAAMYPSGKWFDDNCNNKRHFICLKGRSNGNKGFILLQQIKTWRKAQAFCRENHKDLVSVRNQPENQEILKLLQLQSAWIGLFSDSWKWSDHSNSSFRFWRPKQPNNVGGKQHCVGVVLEDSGRWNDFQCKSSRPFFCQGRMKSKVPLPTTETVTHSGKTTNQAPTKYTPQKSSTGQQTTGYETTQLEKYITTTGPTDKQTLTTKYKYGEQVTTEKAMMECTTKDDLILIQENMTWNEALHYCREHHISLVSVATIATQKWVAMKAENASTAHVWLGLRFTCVFKFWFWITFETGCYQNWAHGYEPTGLEVCGHTGAIESGGEHQWVSLPETEKLNFICYTCDGQRH